MKVHAEGRRRRAGGGVDRRAYEGGAGRCEGPWREARHPRRRNTGTAMPCRGVGSCRADRARYRGRDGYTLNGMAAELERRNVPTPPGGGGIPRQS
jgi:hypothetical protein